MSSSALSGKRVGDFAATFIFRTPYRSFGLDGSAFFYKFAVMTEKMTAIVLDVTKHSDRHDIVSVFSRLRGRISFLSPAGSGKAAALRRSRLLPLSVIESDIHFQATTELQRLGTFSLARVWTDIYFHPVKQLIALFLSEFLNRLLRASMPDEGLWHYIVDSLTLLDNMETGVSDFHITFLASLLPFVGIQPDSTLYAPGMVLNMQAGVFTDRIPPHRDYLSGDEARVAATLCKLNFSNAPALRLNGNLRHRILEGMLRYYGIHYPGTSNLRSLSVIHDLFH